MNAAVLIVDDDPQIGALLDELLTMDGYSVQVARGYAEALRELEARRYDYVLIDFLYPEDPERADGIDVLNAVKQSSPGARTFLMTGLAGNLPIQPVLDKGFDGFLPKPFTVENVRALFKLSVDSD